MDRFVTVGDLLTIAQWSFFIAGIASIVFVIVVLSVGLVTDAPAGPLAVAILSLAIAVFFGIASGVVYCLGHVP